MKLTPWFPVSIKPVREGVYAVEIVGNTVNKFSKWNGRDWLECGGSVDSANRSIRPSYFMQVATTKWRGISE